MRHETVWVDRTIDRIPSKTTGGLVRVAAAIVAAI